MSEPTATYDWRQLPWRKLEVAVLKLQKWIYKASPAGACSGKGGTHDKSRSLEEPCAANVARTVLETSGGSDPLAEFNRALRPAVIARKVSQCSKNKGGAQAFAAFSSVVRTLAKISTGSLVDGLLHVFRSAKMPNISTEFYH